MTLSKGKLYVANTDAIVAFPYKDGDTEVMAPAEKITDLPAKPINHHWTKDVIASEDGTKLYATVGSNSNVGENGMEAEENRAAVLEVDLATGSKRVFASGLRNPNGLSWQPDSKALWVAVNERDEIGSDLVPDYMTSLKDGGFYGWPYSYFGQNVDERVEPPRPDLVEKAIVPDYALGPHTASLGLTFYTGTLLSASYRGGAFVGQHGSWNRKPHSGYKVIFVPFETACLPDRRRISWPASSATTSKAYGRPVGRCDRHARGRSAGRRRCRQPDLARHARRRTVSRLAPISVPEASHGRDRPIAPRCRVLQACGRRPPSGDRRPCRRAARRRTGATVGRDSPRPILRGAERPDCRRGRRGRWRSAVSCGRRRPGSPVFTGKRKFRIARSCGVLRSGLIGVALGQRIDLVLADFIGRHLHHSALPFALAIRPQALR